MGGSCLRSHARLNFLAGDVGYVPRHGYYTRILATRPLRFLEMFKSSYYADVSLDQWMAHAAELLDSLKARSTGYDVLRRKKPCSPA